ncbi:hypothetical protein B0H13DRAFT_1853378 [Mycena leptocephala]|nr:hypothetical protein B0H13DRAFT_1853378 [Mycena leptocephala]
MIPAAVKNTAAVMQQCQWLWRVLWVLRNSGSTAATTCRLPRVHTRLRAAEGSTGFEGMERTDRAHSRLRAREWACLPSDTPSKFLVNYVSIYPDYQHASRQDAVALPGLRKRVEMKPENTTPEHSSKEPKARVRANHQATENPQTGAVRAGKCDEMIMKSDRDAEEHCPIPRGRDRAEQSRKKGS